MRGNPAKGTQYFETPRAFVVPRDISPRYQPAGTHWDVHVESKAEGARMLPPFIFHNDPTATDSQSAAEAAARRAGVLE